MPIKPEHLDELLAGYEKPEDLLGEAAQLFRRVGEPNAGTGPVRDFRGACGQHGAHGAL